MDFAENWWPYQRPSFVTPPFAGYVSGHSTFSRSAAEVLTAVTGDPFFPGGMGEFDCPQDDFLVFEVGPSVWMSPLQWATYYDASDQCSLVHASGAASTPSRMTSAAAKWASLCGTQAVDPRPLLFRREPSATACGVGPLRRLPWRPRRRRGSDRGRRALHAGQLRSRQGPHPADIDLDDLVGTTDLLILLGIFGCTCL